MYDEHRKEMFDGIKTVDGCAAKLSSMLNNADSLQKALSFVACGTWGDTSIEIASYIAAYLQKAWRLRNRCKHVGVPVHVVSPMHVGSAVHVGVAVHAVHVDSAEVRGRWQECYWHNGYVTN